MLFPSSGDLPRPEIKQASPALAGGFFTTEPPGKPIYIYIYRERETQRKRKRKERVDYSPSHVILFLFLFRTKDLAIEISIFL